MHSSTKRKMVAFALFALVGVAMAQVSPWTVKPFNPVTMTATGQTSAVVSMLSPGTSTGNSFASGSITVSGTGLVTATFAVMGSTDYGVNYFPLPLSPIATPGTTALTQTVTASGGIYQVNLATITNVKFVTSGTFTATSVQLLLTASPNGLVARQGGGGGSNPSTTPLSGATIDYNFLEPSGSSVLDISGNGNNATFTAIPPTRNTTGLVFTSSPTQGVALPAAANAGRTFMFGVYINPLLFNASQPTNAFPILLSDNAAGASLNISILRSVSAGNFDASNIYSPTVFRANNRITSSQDLMSGFTVLALVCGLGGGDKDHWYLGGVEVAGPYTTQGSTCATAFTGGLFLGSSGVSPWNQSGFNGTYYRFAVFPTQLTVADIAKNTATIIVDVQNRGVPITPKDIITIAPQLYGVGDSITFGLGATTPWITLLSLTNQPAYVITNYGISGITTKATIGSEPNRVMPKCKSIAGPNIATVMLGTNDFNSAFGATQAQVLASNIAEIKQVKAAGCMVFAATMISRGGNDLLGVLNDTTKNLFDAALLLNIKAAGADGIIDFAADPLVGADGANASATYFQADHIHPANPGHVQMAKAASNSLNYYFGSKLSNPNVVTANTYQMLSSDGAVTATPTATAAYTMPDCTGPSGESYTISNTSAFVVTIVGGTNQPINGLATPINIAANSTATLKDVPNPKNVSGCHWAM